MIEIALYIAGFIIGAAIGSFIGCAIWRIPRGQSMLRGRSACPGCDHRLTAPELVPVGSFIWQGGSARCCGMRLSRAYVVAEVLCGLACLLIVKLLIT